MRTVTVVVAAAVAIALSGCSPLSLLHPNGSAPKTSSPAPATVSAALQPFYSQHLEWSSCGNGMQCTTAKAPLNWDDPKAGSVSLALVRQPAKGKKLGSLLVNPGGPGASGVDFVKDSVNYATDSTLQQNYDIVGFDPPGVGHSTAVKCYDAKQMDSYLYDITPGAIGSDQWIDAETTISKDFGQACEKNTGDLLAHVDTVTAAHDLDLLRAVLGDRKLNYLGYSYGTYLGQVYASLYPKNIGRMVLDGALDADASNFDVNKVQSVGFENALRAYLKDCIANDNDCPFTGTVDQAMQTIAQLLAAVGQNPIRNSDGRELGSETLLTAIIYPLYDQGAWPQLTDMFNQVMKKGSASYAFQLADGYNGRNGNGTYQDNETEAFVSINCLDYTYNDDPAVMRAQAAQLTAAAPVVGPYMSYGDIQCANWPYKSTVVRGPIHAKGAPPIIVVGTTNDPATPYVWAQDVAKNLDSGHLVTYKGQGHTAYNKSNSCVNDAVDNYFVKGTVPASDPMC
jgi:pimeloyl-ACP methyl ester carboxylesterase